MPATGSATLFAIAWLLAAAAVHAANRPLQVFGSPRLRIGGPLKWVGFASRQRLLAAGDDLAVTTFSVGDGRPVARYPSIAGVRALSGDGRVMVTVLENKRVILDARTGARIGSIACDGDARALAIDQAGSRVAFFDADRTCVHRLDDGAEEWSRAGGFDGAISPDGELVASADMERRLRVFDATTGRIVREWRTADHVAALAFVPGRRQLITLTHSAARSWSIDAQDGAVRELVSERGTDPRLAGEIAVSPDGARAAIAFSGYASTYGIAKIDGPFTQHFEACDVVLTPDGRDRLRTSRGERRAIAVPAAGRGPTCVAFTADRRRMICGGADGLLRLWGVPSR